MLTILPMPQTWGYCSRHQGHVTETAMKLGTAPKRVPLVSLVATCDQCRTGTGAGRHETGCGWLLCDRCTRYLRREQSQASRSSAIAAELADRLSKDQP